VLLLGVTLAALSSGCGGRYDQSRCPSSPFPEARALLASPGFEALRFFRGRPDDPRREVETEIWSDAKFAFQASLQYEYARTRPDCPSAVRMLLQYPLSPERIRLGGEFVSVFERRLGISLDAIRAPLRAGEPQGPTEPIVSDAGNAFAEAVSIRTANRGDVLVLTFVERSAHERQSRPSPGHPVERPLADASEGSREVR
jgi:hypothetical protein